MAAFNIFGCRSIAGSDDVTKLAIFQKNTETAPVGTALSTPPAILIIVKNGGTVANMPVAFSADSTSRFISEENTQTNSERGAAL